MHPARLPSVAARARCAGPGCALSLRVAPCGRRSGGLRCGLRPPLRPALRATRLQAPPVPSAPHSCRRSPVFDGVRSMVRRSVLPLRRRSGPTPLPARKSPPQQQPQPQKQQPARRAAVVGKAGHGATPRLCDHLAPCQMPRDGHGGRPHRPAQRQATARPPKHDIPAPRTGVVVYF